MVRAALTGTRIRERRMAMGMRQAELANRIGMSAAYINLIEHNRRRVADSLLEQIAAALEVDPMALAEGAEGVLFDNLREAAAQAPADIATQIESDRIEEFVSRFPGWAALLSERQRQVGALNRLVEQLSERLSEDPFLLDGLHEVISAVTSLRSTAAILTDEPQIEPEWQARFLQTISGESLRLSGAAEALVGYLDAQSGADLGQSGPFEQMEAWLRDQGWSVAELEANPRARVADIVQNAPELASDAARALVRDWLERMRNDIRAFPMARLEEGLARFGMSPGEIAAAYQLPADLVLRRLAQLPAGHPVLPDLGLVICDASGAVIFRRPCSGFALPRYGAGCALWPIYDALRQPMQPLRHDVEIAGRVSQSFTTYAISVPQVVGAGFGQPVAVQAYMLIVPLDPAALLQPRRPIGVTCRICPRSACSARREPSILGAVRAELG
ncbi:short-chain fatty acyl-CoA regulator family protein [Thioclava sp. GXIMD4216]|uniref:Short-chain fatty acyl-CoA regulator family protein n=1 Tax=Thioclava litoralis TaxID=3076557 RepID=A0ABZ1E2C9_9RHOB|nr:short-chain fatty acyl-CoA regulator family protein [Thioclava sp. FTW29]